MADARKNDRDKLPLDLLPSQALKDVTRVLQYGAGKYGRHNWRRGMEWSRYYSAALRHLLAWNEGEDNDQESGLPHLAHATCSLLFLLEFAYYGHGLDNRHKVEEDGTEEY